MKEETCIQKTGLVNKKNKLDYINKQVCQREELPKKEDRVSKKGCMNTNTFRKVLLYIEKEKVLKRKGYMIV